MRSQPRSLLALAGLLLLTASAPMHAREVQVFIVAGQSNAGGLDVPIRSELESRVSTDIALVHVAQGGTPLTPDYTIRPSWHPSVNGAKYDELLAALAAALVDITTAGDTPVLRAMFWMQGEQDAKSGNVGGGLAPPPQPASANNYGLHLQEFISAIRLDSGVADLPFLIGEISIGDDPAIASPASDYNTSFGQWNYTPVVRAQQAAVAAAVPRTALIPTDVSMLGPDYTHFTTDGLNQLATGMVDAYVAITVPEPSALMLAGIGSLVLGCLRRTRPRSAGSRGE